MPFFVFYPILGRILLEGVEVDASKLIAVIKMPQSAWVYGLPLVFLWDDAPILSVEDVRKKCTRIA